MTVRQVWEGLLVELSKVSSPSMLLSDFNYFVNKAVTQYTNKCYNIYTINQQTTDNLRVLCSKAELDANKNASEYDVSYEVILPGDYLHLLNCICVFQLKKDYQCHKANDYVQIPAKKVTADSWPVILEDYYNRPCPQRPYYYINNVNINNTIPTNPITDSNLNGTDIAAKYSDTNSNFPRTIKLGSPFTDTTVSTVDREIAMRYGNPSNVRMEIRCGNNDTIFQLKKVLVDYIKVPQTIMLTQEQLNLTADTSQIMEFPDYVCNEIINELTMLVLENNSDPRLQTNTIVTQSIANPAQQQASSK